MKRIFKYNLQKCKENPNGTCSISIPKDAEILHMKELFNKPIVVMAALPEPEEWEPTTFHRVCVAKGRPVDAGDFHLITKEGDFEPDYHYFYERKQHV